MFKNEYKMEVKEVLIFLLGFIMFGLVGALDFNIMLLCN